MGGEDVQPTAELSLAERTDPERLKARPTWRLCRAHPAVGLQETEADYVGALEPHELGVPWLALAPGEQRARELDYLRALLRYAAACPGARFEAGWQDDAERTVALAGRCGTTLTPEQTAAGSLTEAAVEALLETLPELWVVEGGDRLVIWGEVSPTAIGVWMDRWKAPALERELLDCVHDEAERRTQAVSAAPDVRRRRELDRTLRAHVLVVWSGHGSKVVFAALGLAVLLGWHPFGDGDLADGAVRIVGALVLLIVVDRLVRGWYRRGDQHE